MSEPVLRIQRSNGHADMHERLHFPGQDLTSELPDAPHKKDVFTRPCVKVVGKLEES